MCSNNFKHEKIIFIYSINFIGYIFKDHIFDQHT